MEYTEIIEGYTHSGMPHAREEQTSSQNGSQNGSTEHNLSTHLAKQQHVNSTTLEPRSPPNINLTLRRSEEGTHRLFVELNPNGSFYIHGQQKSRIGLQPPVLPTADEIRSNPLMSLDLWNMVNNYAQETRMEALHTPDKHEEGVEEEGGEQWLVAQSKHTALFVMIGTWRVWRAWQGITAAQYEDAAAADTFYQIKLFDLFRDLHSCLFTSGSVEDAVISLVCAVAARSYRQRLHGEVDWALTAYHIVTPLFSAFWQKALAWVRPTIILLVAGCEFLIGLYSAITTLVAACLHASGDLSRPEDFFLDNEGGGLGERGIRAITTPRGVGQWDAVFLHQLAVSVMSGTTDNRNWLVGSVEQPSDVIRTCPVLPSVEDIGLNRSKLFELMDGIYTFVNQSVHTGADPEALEQMKRAATAIQDFNSRGTVAGGAADASSSGMSWTSLVILAYFGIFHGLLSLYFGGRGLAAVARSDARAARAYYRWSVVKLVLNLIETIGGSFPVILMASSIGYVVCLRSFGESLRRRDDELKVEEPAGSSDGEVTREHTVRPHRDRRERLN